MINNTPLSLNEVAYLLTGNRNLEGFAYRGDRDYYDQQLDPLRVALGLKSSRALFYASGLLTAFAASNWLHSMTSPYCALFEHASTALPRLRRRPLKVTGASMEPGRDSNYGVNFIVTTLPGPASVTVRRIVDKPQFVSVSLDDQPAVVCPNEAGEGAVFIPTEQQPKGVRMRGQFRVDPNWDEFKVEGDPGRYPTQEILRIMGTAEWRGLLHAHGLHNFAFHGPSDVDRLGALVLALCLPENLEQK